MVKARKYNKTKETAYAMKHGFPFLYDWTNAVPNCGVKGECHLVEQLNNLIEKFTVF